MLLSTQGFPELPGVNIQVIEMSELKRRRRMAEIKVSGYLARSLWLRLLVALSLVCVGIVPWAFPSMLPFAIDVNFAAGYFGATVVTAAVFLRLSRAPSLLWMRVGFFRYDHTYIPIAELEKCKEIIRINPGMRHRISIETALDHAVGTAFLRLDFNSGPVYFGTWENCRTQVFLDELQEAWDTAKKEVPHA